MLTESEACCSMALIHEEMLEKESYDTDYDTDADADADADADKGVRLRRGLLRVDGAVRGRCGCGEGAGAGRGSSLVTS